ncbi:right-handed parallel beta-helix repeat-containing protein [Halegenticoccus soli]|uniref:right-handed parallel beta-helix repeat-containing protein n=1 Tax=Halegenticoccus soli TaxID=1985678 RepID=UPI000C6D2762|nr:right-handed parallel beta-helix repeat-containing protein [Halegenticoccus soli]
MAQEESSFRASISRRAYLGAVGVASLTAIGPTVASGDEGAYENVVNIVEAGADNTGEEPIDDVFAEVAADDTLVKFPEGTYVANSLILYGLTNFAMVGEGDATLVPGDDYDPELWIAGGEVENLRIENFTVDNTAEGVGPEFDISAYDGLVLRDIRKVGRHGRSGIAFAFQILRSDGSGLIENVVATDGGDSVGVYLNSEGPVTVRNCHLERFANNGLYASNSTAPITVEGGTFRNNNVAQVRLGSRGSSLTDAFLEVTEEPPLPEDIATNMRGVRIADGPGPVTVENCDIRMAGGEGTGGIVGAYSGGSFEVRDTRIYVDESYTTIGSDGSRTSYGIYVDNATEADEGTRTIETTSITGGGSFRAAMRFRRDNNVVRDSCIQ